MVTANSILQSDGYLNDMTNEVLFFDTGENLLGILSLSNKQYTSYEGRWTLEGTMRLLKAKEVVYYSGRGYDMKQLRAFLGNEELHFEGTVVDMRTISWPNGIRGSNLETTYLGHFKRKTIAHFTEETDNERDCYMTFKLWERWKAGTLDIGSVTIMDPIQD